MDYKEAIKEKIKDESESCKNLWEEIADAYEEGGIENFKSSLTDKADKILNEFKDVLKQLEEKIY